MTGPNQKTVEELRSRAEASFKARHEQAKDAPAATREYREAEQNTRDQMAKLRVERLARGAPKSE